MTRQSCPAGVPSSCMMIGSMRRRSGHVLGMRMGMDRRDAGDATRREVGGRMTAPPQLRSTRPPTRHHREHRMWGEGQRDVHRGVEVPRVLVRCGMTLLTGSQIDGPTTVSHLQTARAQRQGVVETRLPLASTTLVANGDDGWW